MLTSSLCEKWRKNPLKNPITGRPLVKYEKDYMQFHNGCLSPSERTEQEEDDRIFREADKEIKRLQKERVLIKGKFTKEDSLGQRNIIVTLDSKTQLEITSEKKEVIIDMNELRLLSKEEFLDQYPEFTRLIEILEQRFKVPRVDPQKGYNELLETRAPYFQDKFSQDIYIDNKSDELQTKYGGTVLYNLLAHEYGYCIPYILNLEYEYNSEKKDVCELPKEKIEEFSLTADRVTCEIKGVREIEDCKDKGNYLIMIYTRIIIPQRTFKGKPYRAGSDNHMSMLIVNSGEKSVEYFDPEGEGAMSLTCQECLKKWVSEKYPSFIFTVPKGPGIQCLSSKGSCFVLNLLYFYLKMSNEESVESILKTIGRNVNDIVIKFISFLSDLAERRDLSQTIQLFQKYESDIKRLSLEEPKYKEELSKADKLYNKLDIPGLKSLISESVYTSRNEPFEDTPENRLILVYGAPHDPEYLEKQPYSLVIKSAKILLGTNESISFEEAVQILSYPVPYDLMKAVKEDAPSFIIDLILHQENPSSGEIIKAMKLAKSQLIKDILEEVLYKRDPKVPYNPPSGREDKKVIEMVDIPQDEEIFDPILQDDLRTVDSSEIIVIEGKFTQYYHIPSILSSWKNGYALYDAQSGRVVPQYPKGYYGEPLKPSVIRTIVRTSIERGYNPDPLTLQLYAESNLLERIYYFIEYYDRLIKAYSDEKAFSVDDTDRYNRRDILASNALERIYRDFQIPDYGFRKYSDIPSAEGRNGTQVFLSCLLVSFFSMYYHVGKDGDGLKWVKKKRSDDGCVSKYGRDVCRRCLSDKRVKAPEEIPEALPFRGRTPWFSPAESTSPTRILPPFLTPPQSVRTLSTGESAPTLRSRSPTLRPRSPTVSSAPRGIEPFDGISSSIPGPRVAFQSTLGRTAVFPLPREASPTAEIEPSDSSSRVEASSFRTPPLSTRTLSSRAPSPVRRDVSRRPTSPVRRAVSPSRAVAPSPVRRASVSAAVRQPSPPRAVAPSPARRAVSPPRAVAPSPAPRAGVPRPRARGNARSPPPE